MMVSPLLLIFCRFQRKAWNHFLNSTMKTGQVPSYFSLPDKGKAVQSRSASRGSLYRSMPMYRFPLPFPCLKKRRFLLTCCYLVAYPVGSGARIGRTTRDPHHETGGSDPFERGP